MFSGVSIAINSTLICFNVFSGISAEKFNSPYPKYRRNARVSNKKLPKLSAKPKVVVGQGSTLN